MEGHPLDEGLVSGMGSIVTPKTPFKSQRKRWASQFICPIHGKRTYDQVDTTKSCAEVMENGRFCNRVLIRGTPDA